jgi:hypothetical protein
MVAWLPGWSRVLLVGVIGAIVVSFVNDWMFPAESEGRAYWSLVQLAVGGMALLAGQLWAVLMSASGDERVGLLEMLGLSLRLWGRTVQRLPLTRWPVWLCSWGLSLAVGALILVGDPTTWLNVSPRKPPLGQSAIVTPPEVREEQRKQLEQASAVGVMENMQRKRMEGKLESLNITSIPPKPVDVRPTVDCLVIGYVSGKDASGKEDGSFNGLILATLRDGKLVPAGVVQKGFTTEERQDLFKRFATLKREAPLIGGTNIEDGKPVWLDPVLRCEVHQSGTDDQGVLRNPWFKSLFK